MDITQARTHIHTQAYTSTHTYAHRHIDRHTHKDAHKQASRHTCMYPPPDTCTCTQAVRFAHASQPSHTVCVKIAWQHLLRRGRIRVSEVSSLVELLHTQGVAAHTLQPSRWAPPSRCGPSSRWAPPSRCGPSSRCGSSSRFGHHSTRTLPAVRPHPPGAWGGGGGGSCSVPAGFKLFISVCLVSQPAWVVLMTRCHGYCSATARRQCRWFPVGESDTRY